MQHEGFKYHFYTLNISGKSWRCRVFNNFFFPITPKGYLIKELRDIISPPSQQSKLPTVHTPIYFKNSKTFAPMKPAFAQLIPPISATTPPIAITTIPILLMIFLFISLPFFLIFLNVINHTIKNLILL